MATDVEVQVFVLEVALTRPFDEMHVDQAFVAWTLHIEVYEQVVVALAVCPE